ncbi:MAG: dihydropteroate synthase [Bacteroidota bacterium]
MTIHCKGKLIDLSTPKVMGILNSTPDSFFDGGKYNSEKNLLLQAEKMIREGATFIDIGGYSSRPGADHISQDEELKRVLPAITLILRHFPDALISIDTFRSHVASQCIAAGAVLVNDIAAGSMDKHMMATIAKHQVPYIMMHLKGTPQNMQQRTHYKNIVKDILFYFSEKVAFARYLGINDLIIDPGFGFAKTLQHNYEILRHLECFKTMELPLMVGISRKSMIYKSLNISAEEALNGTTSLHTVALIKGANILRVHDVKEAVECIALTNRLHLAKA